MLGDEVNVAGVEDDERIREDVAGLISGDGVGQGRFEGDDR